MKIVSLYTLTDQQSAQIVTLQDICNSFDKLKNTPFLSNDINFDKSFPCFYLCYDDNQTLVSFLTTFVPEPGEAELIAFTHPEHRKKGYFTSLLKVLIENMKKFGVPKILFVIEPPSKSGLITLEKYSPITLNRSEYRLHHKNPVSLSKHNHMTYEITNEQNKQLCVELNNLVFPSDGDKRDTFIDNAINSLDREAYITFLNNNPIGIFNLHFEEDSAFIYGLGIIPEFQGKGHGKQLLEIALSKAYEKSQNVILDVDSNNPSAYYLYIKNGFEIDFQADYYEYII